MNELMRKVESLRWDDHRYYHQSRVNQTLHLISAISFVVAYAALFFEPAIAAAIGWLIGMVTRQSGHIFFEPRGFDPINRVSDEYKESIKVGYNMRRKALLIALWLSIPLVLRLDPGLSGLFRPAGGFGEFARQVGLLWLALGVAGVFARCLQLSLLRGPDWALAWAVKIVTDPFHNIAIYWRSPIALMRGQWFDPIHPEEEQATA